jgi:hypothetical protein
MRDVTLVIILAIAAGMAVAATVAQAEERPTIVGTWSTAAGKCVKPLSLISIGPKSLSGEDFSCDFKTVTRKNDVVTFRGQCSYGADDPLAETVVARLDGLRLHYRFMSQRGENGPFMRCP